MPHIIRAPTTSLTDPLYPEHMECPHLGCWKYRFRNSSDSFRHECLFHPGQRMQRRVELYADPNQESALCTHTCRKCELSFQTKKMLNHHVQAYDHKSQQTKSFRKNVASRAGQLPPQKPPPRMLSLQKSLFPNPIRSSSTCATPVDEPAIVDEVADEVSTADLEAAQNVSSLSLMLP